MAERLILQDIHSCLASNRKAVNLETDLLGNTKCGYCHNIINMRSLIGEG